MGVNEKYTGETQNYMFPTSADEMKKLGWERADIILFTGDAFVDHPAFGTAIIARVLQAEGYKVAVIAQPNWRDDLRDFRKLGAPALFFGISSGNMDSMVNHYTARKRLRSDDAYTPGGKAGFRPDYAVQVYSDILRKQFPDIPQVLGGIEASLRRVTHYDYWSDTLKPSLLHSSSADIITYGMSEKAIVIIAGLAAKGIPSSQWKNIPQTVVRGNEFSTDSVVLPSFQECVKDKSKYATHFVTLEKMTNRVNGKTIVEPGADTQVIIYPSADPLIEEELDAIYDLPYTRMPHPRYRGKPPIPAWEMIRDSITIHRGCFGGCSFCALTMHQGRTIQSRSRKSVKGEVVSALNIPDFKGTLTDIGGPSANMYGMKPEDLARCVKCQRPSCIYPSLCINLKVNYTKLLELYKEVRETKGVKHVYVSSGIRYDLILDEKDFLPGAKRFFEDLIAFHVSGRLKVAPENTSDKILKLMRKPSFTLFRRLVQAYDDINRKNGKHQQIVPYLITGFPGCTFDDAADMASKLFGMGIYPEQIQDFTPTPMTLASAMYYLGYDPYSGEKLFIAKEAVEKKLQNDIILSHKSEVRSRLLADIHKIKSPAIREKIRTLWRKR